MPSLNMTDDGSQPLYTWLDFHIDVREILRQLKASESTITAVIGIPRGGLVLATMLSHALTIPLYVRSLPEPWDTTSTLVCDDNAITGGSLQPFAHRGMPCAVLVKHPNAITVTPFFAARESDEMYLFPWEVEAAHDEVPLEDVMGF